jgi:hypothetical protein
MDKRTKYKVNSSNPKYNLYLMKNINYFDINLKLIDNCK